VLSQYERSPLLKILEPSVDPVLTEAEVALGDMGNGRRMAP
jgi:hypothetical protein